MHQVLHHTQWPEEAHPHTHGGKTIPVRITDWFIQHPLRGVIRAIRSWMCSQYHWKWTQWSAFWYCSRAGTHKNVARVHISNDWGTIVFVSAGVIMMAVVRLLLLVITWKHMYGHTLVSLKMKAIHWQVSKLLYPIKPTVSYLICKFLRPLIYQHDQNFT